MGGQVRGELLFDKDRQYLGYRLRIAANGQQHTVDVTGAASRMLPGNVFSRDDMARLAVLDAKTAPPESGNVAAGFMATALQGSHLARHRAEQRGTHTPDTPPAAAQHRTSARPPATARDLTLLSDDDLAQYRSRLAHAAQAASERLATAASAAQALADRYAQDGGETVARLTAAAATPDLIERAKTAAAEDVAHALRAAQAAKQQLDGINSRIQQAAQEAERRAGLTPQQRQAEQVARRQHAARQQARPSPVPPPGPKITGPEGPSRGGASIQ
jgi:hypothetical protein